MPEAFISASGRRRLASSEYVRAVRRPPSPPRAKVIFPAFARTLRPATLTAFEIDGEGRSLPDPATRSQPQGTLGLSEVVDASAFAWQDRDWKGPPSDNPVIYEMHIGTFTREGTWLAASEKLPRLAEVEVTLIEMMPVASFAGTRGWGYDGVCWFAPTHLYGRPDDLRHFIDRAHALGLGVILDVVYNHFGPSGNCLTSVRGGLYDGQISERMGKGAEL